MPTPALMDNTLKAHSLVHPQEGDVLLSKDQ